MNSEMDYTLLATFPEISADLREVRQVDSGANLMGTVPGESREVTAGRSTAMQTEPAVHVASPAAIRILDKDMAYESSRQGTGAPSAYGAALESSFSQPFPEFTSPPRVRYSDRFIPSRIASSFTNYSLMETSPSSCNSQNNEISEDGGAAYSSLLRTELFGADAALAAPRTPDKSSGGPIRDSSPSPSSAVRNLFRFKSDSRSSSSPGGPESPYSLAPVGDEDLATAPTSPRRLPRRIPRSPFKVLDAPALADDFYLNLVDWSEHNVLAVGLGTCIYLWSACTSKVTKLCDLGPDDTVCAVGWTQRGTYLAVGTNKGEVQIWDTIRCKKLRSLGGHRTRVGSLAWNSHVLSSGGRDRIILHHDIRVDQDFVSRLTGHKSEVCGLKWSPDDRELASGGNDNQLLVWNQHAAQPVLRFQAHQAAVKAIAWSPHQHGLLASGGGTADRCIRFWNTATGASLACVDTGSQVCNLAWSKNVNEVVSTHGYSQNQIVIWKYPTMSKLATLTGHTMRVLFLSISPDGQTIVTGAGDETLRFWNAFPPAKRPVSVRESGIWALGRTQIR